MSQTRIYKITHSIGDTDDVRLVEAANAAQAIRHVVKGCVVCEPCSVPDALALGAGGVKVEKAGE